jgi:hypothetical protein
MIGPGWMPSRPRPLVRVRRQIASYAPYLQRRSRRARNATTPATPGALHAARTGGRRKIRHDGGAAACDTPGMLFDGPPAELPIATLLPAPRPGRRRLIRADLDRWIALRWAWVLPRAIPLVVAIAGLFGTLGAVKYAGQWAQSDRLTLEVHTRLVEIAPLELRATVQDRREPARLVVRPLGLHDRYLVLTIDRPDTP